MATVARPSAAALSSGRIVKPVWRVRNVQEARVFAAEFEPDSWRIPIESAPEPAYPFGAKAEARLLVIDSFPFTPAALAYAVSSDW